MLDKIVVIIFLITTLIIGIYNRSRSSTLSGFNNIDKLFRSNKLVITATIFASSVGGGTIFGLTEKIYLGKTGFIYGLFLSLIFDILIAIYVIPKFSKYYKLTSVGEIISKSYGRLGRVIAGFAAFFVSVGYLSAQIAVSGIIFSYLFEVNYKYAVLLSYVVAITYTTVGGLRSVIANNVYQFFVIILCIPMISFFGIREIGLINFINSVKEFNISPFSNPNLMSETIMAFLSFSVMGFHPAFLQRILISEDSRVTSKSMIYKTFILSIFLIFILLNALISKILLPDVKYSIALLEIITIIFPAGVIGFILIGFISAVMSTADSDLNVASISFTNDVLRVIFNITDQKFLLRLNKILTIFIGLISIFTALYFKDIIDIIIFSSGLWSPIILVPLIGIIFGYKLSNRKFIFCIIFGILSFIIWNFCCSKMNISSIFVGTFVSFIFFIFSKPEKFSV